MDFESRIYALVGDYKSRVRQEVIDEMLSNMGGVVKSTSRQLNVNKKPQHRMARRKNPNLTIDGEMDKTLQKIPGLRADQLVSMICRRLHVGESSVITQLSKRIKNNTLRREGTRGNYIYFRT